MRPVSFPGAQQPNPMPGNPTPPLTPGSVHNVPPYPSLEASKFDGKGETDKQHAAFIAMFDNGNEHVTH